MKRIALVTLIFLTSIVVTAQQYVKNQSKYEAVTWPLKMLDHPEQVTISAAPSAAQTKAELQSVKKSVATVDDKKLAEITYWNAGAPAYRWNQINSKLSVQRFDIALRMPASWMNLAIYDATILAWKEKLKYKRKRPNEVDPSIKTIIDAPGTYSYPCEHSVTAAAAANVLAYFFPEKADSILKMARTASQSRVNAGVQFTSDADAGWKLGEQVAKQIIEKAKNDGSATVWDGKMNTDPKKWTGKNPMGITLASFVPMVIKSANQFRPPPPPDFEKDMKELKAFKQTAKSAAIAHFWATNGDVWNELAGLKMFEYGLHNNAPEAARIYATLTSAYHDVAIAIMDAKYTYWGIRPDQYDTTYKPLIATPPFPGYPSGHAAGAATSAAVLETFFPADAAQFRQLAKECADSRFYAGIHFRTDNESGAELGKAVGKYVANAWAKK